jgi:hypothetical protein
VDRAFVLKSGGIRLGVLLLLLCALFGPFLSACSNDASEDAGAATAVAPGGPRVALNPGTSPGELEALLRRDLAGRLGLPVRDVSLVETCDVTWPDGSIGVAEPGTAYTQALVPGWLAILEARGKQYRYHGTPGGFIAATFVPGAKVDSAVSC